MQRGFFEVHPIFILDQNTHNIIDVNRCAIDKYGISKEQFCTLNINDLGEKKKRLEIISPRLDDDQASDKIWIHKAKDGTKFYTQFTTHIFNYKGERARLAVAHDVTEQVKRKEKNVNKFPKVHAENSFHSFARITWNVDKTVLRWSEKAEEMFGWREDEVVGREDFFKRFIHEDEQEAAFEVIDNAFKNMKTSYQVDGRVIDKKGRVRVCEWNNTIIYDNAGNAKAVYSQVQDVTERKRSQLLFETLAEESLVGIYLIQDGVFRYVNPKFCEIFGYSKQEIVNKLGPVDLTAPEDRPLVKENNRKRFEKEVHSIAYDFKAKHKSGKDIHIEAYGSYMKYLGKPAIIGTLLDITGTKVATNRYKASVESFENLFDSISDAVHILNKEGEFLKVNNAAVKLYGYSRKELIGQTPDLVLAPDKNSKKEIEEYFKSVSKDQSKVFNVWAKRKNGEVFPKRVNMTLGSYMGKDVFILISRDESERYEVEQRVKQSEKQFWQLFKNAPLGIAMMDQVQDLRMVNPAFEQMFGYKSEEIKGSDVDMLIVPEKEYLQASDISEKVYKGGISTIRTKRKRKDGSLIDVLIYGVPVKLKERVIAIFGIYVDITDRIEYQEKIEKSLKEKEVMLAEIHHRVKNNLAVITGLLELQQFKTDSEEAKDILRESQFRINSIALIHEKLYRTDDFSQVSIDVYVKELSDIISQSMQKETDNISVTVNADATYLTINQAIPCGLILNELITNAYKHAFRGKEEGNINITLKSEDDHFNLIYKDNGKGIPDTVDLENSDSLGMTLIKTLSRQLNGRYKFISKNKGLGFSLQFQIDR